MGGTSSSDQTSNSTQQMASTGTANPWANAMPSLNNILGSLGNVSGTNVGPNAAQTGALGQLSANANNMPNYTPQAMNLSNSLMTGGPDYTGMVNNGLNNYQNATQNYQQQLSPYTNASYLDPTKSPGMGNVLSTIQSDVGNSVNSQFAGAGRDMSGMNQQAIARGMSQGMAAPLLNQYNQNVATQRGAQDAGYGASGNAYNAGNTSTGLLSNLSQTSFGNQMAGLNLGMSAVPQAMNAGPNAQLAAQAQAYGLPMNNLGMLEGLTIPIAGLGGTTTNTANGSASGYQRGTQQMSGAQQFGLIAGGLGSLAKMFAPTPTPGG